jgi:uncharacterized repeat protein (TIGR03806 family)
MIRFFTLSLLVGMLAVPRAHAQLVRQANTTLKFPQTITSSPGQLELGELLPGISFDRPVCVATAPGETRLFVVERVGRVWVIADLANPTKELFLDISGRVHAADWEQSRRTEGLSSIAFHPNFASNHRFFVTYNLVTTTIAGNGHHNRVSEFRASNDHRTGLANSEIPMITQFDEGDGHNINDLHFGPDGYLYIATGDEGDAGTGDDFNNAQRIDKDFFSAIMRIDVDKKSGNLTPNSHPASHPNTYKIPIDNPYVATASFNGIAVDRNKVRTEFFAVGLRNPWRFSFDPQTDKIYEGDVGQHGREEVNVIVKGGNYGWAFKEGTLGGSKAGSTPPTFNSIAPIYEYGTGFGSDQGFSVTGGVVYRGNRVPSLFGHLIFADYVSGNIWAMNIDSQPYQKPTRLFSVTGIAGFGYDPRNGDVLLVDHDRGRILKLQQAGGGTSNLPATLSESGIFADLATLRPNTGIYPYDVNVPLWSDDALKKRWFHIPADKKMRFNADGNWTFPSGSVWIKHFDLEMTLGDPSTAKRIETRVLVKTDSGLYGLSYKWDLNGQSATLVGDGGDARGLLIYTGTTTRRQGWRFPSRSECLSCHTTVGGQILGFNTPQMNRDYGYGSVTTNQIGALSKAGFFENPPAHTHDLLALAPLDDASSSREFRARSYLFANCGQCHQPGGTIYAAWDARPFTPISQAGIVHGRLLNTSGTSDKVITPGDTNASAVIKRMSTLGEGRMPPLASTVVDRKAIQLLTEWVTKDLPAFKTYDTWAQTYFVGSIPLGRVDSDGDGANNYTEYLLGTNPKVTNSFPAIGARTNNQFTLNFQHPANRGVLFEWAPDLPTTNWAPLAHPQNKLIFPSETANRSITDVLNGQRRYYRMRVIEP